MNHRFLTPVALLAVLLCASITILARSDPKHALREGCIQCGQEGDCKACVGGGNSSYCRTFNCGSCGESGECALLFSLNSNSARNRKPLKVPSNVIRKISIKHPRFAITLAEMNGYGISPGKHRIHWTPVKLFSSDVEAFLNRGIHSEFFKHYDKEARRLNRRISKGEISNIVYTVSVNSSDDGTGFIKMQVEDQTGISISGDPSYSTLEIRIDSNHAPTSKGSKKTVSWQIQ